MWREISRAFGEVARDYEAWYQGNPLFASELRALLALGPIPSPSLEIGVGTGVFAKALGFTHGLDPSLDMLLLARQKGLLCVCGVGERLPFKDEIFEACGMFFTLCFLSRPEEALEECYRVLKPEGKLFLGFVPRESPWGQYYEEKKRAGHKLYRFARFREGQEVLNLLKEKGFRLVKGSSTLFQPPGLKRPLREEPREGFFAEAGFWALVAIKD